MTEPSSSVPEETANADTASDATESEQSVELDIDEEKVEAWNRVKSDYEVDPGGEPVPNVMDEAPLSENADNEEESGREAEAGGDMAAATSDETDTPAVSDSAGPDDAVASEEDAERQDEAQ